VPTALGLAWLGPVLSSIQHIVPLNMRSTASAIFLFVNNLIGIGLGTVMLGLISDALSSRYGEDSLRYAILAGSVFYLVAAALFLLSARRLERDWE
jgi:MFS family permease